MLNFEISRNLPGSLIHWDSTVGSISPTPAVKIHILIPVWVKQGKKSV